jgi:hypothetical protein
MSSFDQTCSITAAIGQIKTMIFFALSILLLAFSDAASSSFHSAAMWTTNRGMVLHGTDNHYERLTSQTDNRNMGVFVMWTALNRDVKCPMCGPFDKIFAQTAKKFGAKAAFLRMELQQTEQSFKQRGMQMVPALDFYPACADGPKDTKSGNQRCSPKSFDAKDQGFTMSAMQEFVAQHVGRLPASPMRVLALIAVLGVGAALMVICWGRLLALARNPMLVSVFSTVSTPSPHHRCHVGVCANHAVGGHVVQDPRSRRLPPEPQHGQDRLHCPGALVSIHDRSPDRLHAQYSAPQLMSCS